MSTQPMPSPCGPDQHRPRYWGKYRGKVLNNFDPLFQGRIMAEVPAIPGSLLNYALPCTPYAGFGVGFYAIPPNGANVWIEFEGGDPNFPVWVGCFWGPTDILSVPGPPPPEVKVFKTQYITMVLNDLPGAGGFTLKCAQPAVGVPLSIVCNLEGITLSCPEATIAMTPASIALRIPEAAITMAPANITATVPESVITMTPESISIAVPASSINLTAELMAVAAAELNITSITSIEGETNIMPLLSVEGDANVVGALTSEGDTNVLGALTTEGDVNIVGGLTIEGGGEVDGIPII